MRDIIGLIHFQPLERYPPAMNFINSLKRSGASFFAVTQKVDNSFFEFTGENIHKINLSKCYGPLKHICFHYNTILFLFRKRPKTVVVYEHYSLLAAWLYTLFFRKTRVHIHFHELVLREDDKKLHYSRYLKFLFLIEKKFIKRVSSISHTNEDRKNIYLKNNQIAAEKIVVLPNYPPGEWAIDTTQLPKKEVDMNSIQFVIVGAVSTETMYIREFLALLENTSHRLHIYSNNNNLSGQFKNHENVVIHNPVSYFSLPSEISKYDIGLVLYKGHIANHRYCLPNKVVEYLSCGLPVWYSDALTTTTEFKVAAGIDALVPLDFSGPVEFSERMFKFVDLEKLTAVNSDAVYVPFITKELQQH